MTDLADLMSLPQLEEMVEQGYVSRRLHREHPYAILNYTDKAQYDNLWNDVTRQCRGLIYRLGDEEIIARPFKKFFNYGQAGADGIGLDEPAYVTDKMDGSLGIAYRTPDGGLAIATRGSFHSEQAEWATAWLRYNLAPSDLDRLARWSATYTDLFEIIYPENRIVVNYGERAELVYLASVHVHFGEVDRFSRNAVPTADTPLLAGSLRKALEIEPRENAEGVVVMTPDGRAVKLKQDDYLVKHKARFSLTPTRIWEALTSGMELSDFLAGLPDEFHGAVVDVWGKIEANALVHHMLATDSARIARGMATRKEQAAYIQSVSPNHAAAAFALLDGNDEKAGKVAYKAVKPAGPEASRLIAA